jgi:probable F420-dependent oxidoreductase
MDGVSRLQVAVAIPQTPETPAVDVPALATFIQEAETLGVHSLWVQEQILGAHPSLEPLMLLAHAAALTRRPRLGVAVLLTLLRNPIQLAKALASLDQLSAGRLVVGVGLGDETAHYPAFGITSAARVRRFTEGLEVMKRLWSEDCVTSEGRFWTLRAAAVAPKPIQRPHLPIWIGARHPAALRRAARLGDGFIGAGASSTQEFAAHVALLRRFLAENGRDAARYPIAKRVYVALDENRSRALTRLRRWFGAFYGDSGLADRVALVGGGDACAAGVREVQAAGADLVILNFVDDELASLRRAARELLPRLNR